MGSATLWRLAGRGARAIGFEQFQPGHDLGSSHGRSRIIRTAYAEGSDYVPLVRESFRLWRELEREGEAELLTMTGALMIGLPGSALVSGALASARAHDLDHEVLLPDAAVRRFPFVAPRPDEVAVHEPEAGVLRPTEAVLAALACAERSGAEVVRGVAVDSLEPLGGRVRLAAGGEFYEARHVVVAVGSWLGTFLPNLTQVLEPERQVVAWYRLSDPGVWAVGRAAVFMCEPEPGVIFYGMPTQDGRTAKVASHHGGTRPVHPDTVDRAVTDSDHAPVRRFIHDRLRGVTADVEAGEVCLYTNTPDERFLVGPAPGVPDVTVLGGFSGHGFKFAPVIGDAAAELATQGHTRHPIGAFALDRFTTPQGHPSTMTTLGPGR